MFWGRGDAKWDSIKCYRPNGVINVVSNADCLSRGICQNPELALIFENTFPPPSIASDCSTDGEICLSLQTARLSLVRSTHMRILPSGFGTITMPTHHGVACSTRDITPRLSILSNSFFTLGSKGMATRLRLLREKETAGSYSLI